MSNCIPSERLEPSSLEIEAVRALRSGGALNQAALNALEALSKAPKRLMALNALLDAANKPAPAEDAELPRIARPRISAEQVIAAGREFHRTYGRIPSQRSPEPVPGIPGHTWSSIHHSGRFGRNGLEKGQTLSSLMSLVREELSLPTRGSTAALSAEGIENAALEHFRTHGKMPTMTSREPVPGYGSLRWESVFRASYIGTGIFSRGPSIYELIERAEARR